MAVRINWENNDSAKTFVGYGECHLLKQCVHDRSTLFYLGKIDGKSILDLGCGEGHFCRLLKSKGASRVLGVDMSSLMIEKSKQHDVEGICEYQVGNIYEMGKIGEFDYVTANLVLSHVGKIEDLLSMCRCFYDNLKPGGRFVGAALNCLKGDYDWGKSLEKYNIDSFTRTSKTDKMTTCELILKPIQQTQYKAICYYFDPQVTENAFLQNGFRSFCFKPPHFDKEILGKFPENFWDDYFENPHMISYVAQK